VYGVRLDQISGRSVANFHCTLKKVILKKVIGEIAFAVALRKVDIRLPGKGHSNSHGARPVY